MKDNSDLNSPDGDLGFNIDLSGSPDQSNTSSQSKSTTVQISSKNIEEKQKNNKGNQQISSSDKIDFTNFLQHAKNPGIVFFTLFFKGLAMASFLLLGIFGVSDALIFIFVVILNSLDFWFVKNVSGRILVGLRWWNEVKEDGSEVWRFESSHEVKARSIDTTIFWMSLYIAPLFWGIFLFLELIGLKIMWFLACLIAFILTFSNTFGYYKCSGEQKNKIKGFLNNKTQEGFSKIMQFGISSLGNKN